MSNTILTHSMIAERALFDLHNNLVMAKNVYKGYNSEFNSVGRFKKGASVAIQLPNKFRAKTAVTRDPVDHLERSTTVTVDTQQHVSWDFTERELTLSIEDFSRKYINPATIALADKVDSDGAAEYKNIYNSVGTPGTTPSTFKVLADAAERLANESVPQERWVGAWSPRAAWSLADGELKSIFNPAIVEQMVRRGFMGMFAQTDHYMTQSMTAHTTGLWNTGSTGVMNGATAEGATSLVTNGWANSTAILKKGDVITIAGVYGCNPVSGKVWENNQLRQFTVTADVTSSAAGAATIPVSPPIYSSAASETYLPYQTVVTLPANGAAITVLGTESSAYMQNMIFHPDAFALTMVPFARPKSAGKSVMWAQASDDQLGLSITIATAFDIDAYSEATRLDILYGWDTIQSNYAVRVFG